ncbi:MAG: hypothetical protein HC836_46920 [Richelia sp. RM2_1_2]|nr:hypothetical protein [Richelia sp. RM2_1_2]
MKEVLLLLLGLSIGYRYSLTIEEEFVKVWSRIEVQKMRADKLEQAIKKICPECETR